MKVIPPLTITDAMLTYSPAWEAGPAAYNSGTTYALNNYVSVAGAAGLVTVYKSLQSGNIGHAPASSPTWWVSLGNVYQDYSGAATYTLGDFVQDASAHIVYESLQAGNIGHPLSAAIESGAVPTATDWWVKAGPTNRWAMFDLLRNTRTVIPASMLITLTPGVRVDSLALLGMVANSVNVSITSAAVVVYNHTFNLDTRDVFDWFGYFFNAFTTQESLALFDLPPYANAIISVTFTATSGNVECGACVIGSSVDIGEVEYNAESDVLNFSTVIRDFAGNTSVMVQRRNVPKTISQIVLDKSRVNAVRNLRDALAGLPAVWAGLDDSGDGYFEALLIIGFYKKFTINLAMPEHAVVSLELEEI
jgi:hypothetical protein